MTDFIYRLYYWPGLPGRGEFVRLLLEDAQLPYVDVARLPEAEGGGASAVRELVEDGVDCYAPPIFEFAPGKRIAQTANICQYLGVTHDLVHEDPFDRMLANQLQLTIADLVTEVHDTHHPIATGQHYEEQREAALLRAAVFRQERLPKYFGFFERTIASMHNTFLLGARCTYPDLSLWHVLEGVAYAFPKAHAAIMKEYPRLRALKDTVGAREGIAAYVASGRRMPFNERGIFRHYPELDGVVAEHDAAREVL
ncbi:MAG: glutathione S-transferase [Myxococcota bacterium]